MQLQTLPSSGLGIQGVYGRRRQHKNLINNLKEKFPECELKPCKTLRAHSRVHNRAIFLSLRHLMLLVDQRVNYRGNTIEADLIG